MKSKWQPIPMGVFLALIAGDASSHPVDPDAPTPQAPSIVSPYDGLVAPAIRAVPQPSWAKAADDKGATDPPSGAENAVRPASGAMGKMDHSQVGGGTMKMGDAP